MVLKRNYVLLKEINNIKYKQYKIQIIKYNTRNYILHIKLRNMLKM